MRTPQGYTLSSSERAEGIATLLDEARERCWLDSAQADDPGARELFTQLAELLGEAVDVLKEYRIAKLRNERPSAPRVFH